MHLKVLLVHLIVLYMNFIYAIQGKLCTRNVCFIFQILINLLLASELSYWFVTFLLTFSPIKKTVTFNSEYFWLEHRLLKIVSKSIFTR